MYTDFNTIRLGGNQNPLTSPRAC